MFLKKWTLLAMLASFTFSLAQASEPAKSAEQSASEKIDQESPQTEVVEVLQVPESTQVQTEDEYVVFMQQWLQDNYAEFSKKLTPEQLDKVVAQLMNLLHSHPEFVTQLKNRAALKKIISERSTKLPKPLTVRAKYDATLVYKGNAKDQEQKFKGTGETEQDAISAAVLQCAGDEWVEGKIADCVNNSVIDVQITKEVQVSAEAVTGHVYKNLDKFLKSRPAGAPIPYILLENNLKSERQYYRELLPVTPNHVQIKMNLKNEYQLK